MDQQETEKADYNTYFRALPLALFFLAAAMWSLHIYE